MRSIPALPLLILLCSACGPRVDRITMEPVIVRSQPGGESVIESPEEKLEEIAEQQERGECEAAIPRLQRFVEAFPESVVFPEAVMRLGICHAERDEHALARSYFRFVAARVGGELGARAGLRAAYALESLKDFEQAAREYRAISRRKGVPTELRAGARFRRAVSLFHADEPGKARRELAAAVRAYTPLDSPPESIRAAAAEAHFMAAEKLGSRFRDVRLEYPQKKLEKRLKEKLEALARARDAYTDVTRFKDPEWAGAAVFRIGELFDRLREELLAVPPPPNLTRHQRAMYVRQLEARVNPLHHEAFQSYLQVVALGERVGIENQWVAGARERVRELESELKQRVLLPEEDDARDAELEDEEENRDEPAPGTETSPPE